MDSEDEYDESKISDLPDEAEAEELSKKIDLVKLVEKRSCELEFDAPEVVVTEKAKYSNPSLPDYNEKLWEKTRHIHLTEEHRPIMEVMVGDFSDIEKLMANITEDGSLKKLLIRPGTGEQVKVNDMAKIHYIVSLEYGDDILSSTYENDYGDFATIPKRYRVGKGEVLSVIDLGLPTMREGEVAKFLGDSRFGYGKMGIPDSDIPPDCRIMAQVEVLDASPYKADDTISEMSSVERRELPFDRFFEHTMAYKELGNDKFKEEEYDDAIILYKEVKECLMDMNPVSSEQIAKHRKLLVQTLSNVALCYLKLEEHKLASKYALSAATMTGVSSDALVKPAYLYAKIQFIMGNYETAKDFAYKCDMARSDPEVRQLVQKINKKLGEAANVEREICKRMVSGHGNEVNRK